MTRKTIVVSEPRSGLNVSFHLKEREAPESTSFLWDFLSHPREIPAIHAMWTGPEISCPIPGAMLGAERKARALAPENATVTPQAGDLVLAYVPSRMWGGSPEPIFDLGFFYGPGGRLLFPIGWLAGNVVAQIEQSDFDALAAGCKVIRQNGACTLHLSRVE